MISIFVTIQIKPEFRERFMEASLGDARGSVRDEPACYRFDILQADSDPNRFHLYEVYADEAAMEAHRNAPPLHNMEGNRAGLVRRRTSAHLHDHGVPVG